MKREVEKYDFNAFGQAIKEAYFNTKLIALHQLSESMLNYHMDHYEAIARKSYSFKEENIQEYATQNLKLIGEMYQYE